MSDEIKKLKKIRTHSIVGIVLLFTLIGAIVTLVFEIIDGITILSTKWSNEELDDSKILWGILTFVLLGSIASLVFAVKGLNLYKE